MPGASGVQPFDETAVESRVVWIMGSPRTGSTWLLRMLIYPWILSRKEPTGMRAPFWMRRAQLPDVVPVDESYIVQHLMPRAPVDVSGDRQPDPDEFLVNTARGADAGYVFSDQYADAWRPEVRRLILVRFWAHAELAARRHRVRDALILVKEPNGSYGAHRLMSLLPRSRLLFLVRDGRDVVDSMIDAMRSWADEKGRFELDQPAKRLNFIRRESRLWLNSTTAVLRAYDSHPPALRTMVRYEDLRRDPEESVRPLLDWLGIERDERLLRETIEANAFEALPRFMKGSGTPRRAASPGLWRENMTAEEQAAMNEIMGPKLAALGYQPSQSAVSQSSSTSR